MQELRRFTVLDLTNTEHNGEKHAYVKRLFPARLTVAQMLFDKKEAIGSLVGRKFKFKRYQPKDASTGTIVDNDKEIHPIYTALSKEEVKPYDYIELLKPPTEEELQRKFGIAVKKLEVPEVKEANSEEMPLELDIPNLDDIPSLD